MRFNGKREHVVDFIFTLALFCVFAASSVLVTVIGASVYKTVVARMDQNNTARTGLAYLAEKVRQNDAGGALSAGAVADSPALVMTAVYNDTEYATYIYEDGGELKELFQRASAAPMPDAGQTIMEAASFDVELLRDNLYRFTIQDEKGESFSIDVYAKSEAPLSPAGAERRAG